MENEPVKKQNDIEEESKASAETKIKKEESLEFLLEIYDIANQQYDSVWKSYVQGMLISVTGLLAGFILAFRELDNGSPAFLIIPPFIMAWYSLIEIQGKALITRGRYIAMLETKLSMITGSRFPLSETFINPLVYNYWVFRVHVYIVALPFLIMYVVSVILGVRYAETVTIFPGEALVLFYILWFVFPFVVHARHTAYAQRKLAELEKELGLSSVEIPGEGQIQSLR